MAESTAVLKEKKITSTVGIVWIEFIIHACLSAFYIYFFHSSSAIYMHISYFYWGTERISSCLMTLFMEMIFCQVISMNITYKYCTETFLFGFDKSDDNRWNGEAIDIVCPQNVGWINRINRFHEISDEWNNLILALNGSKSDDLASCNESILLSKT